MNFHTEKEAKSHPWNSRGEAELRTMQRWTQTCYSTKQLVYFTSAHACTVNTLQLLIFTAEKN